MFQIGDLVEVKTRFKNDAGQLIGLVEIVVDGKVGVRYLNSNDFGIDNFHNQLRVYVNPLDYLQKIDKVEEEES
jgi:hypothetical protein